MKDDLRSMNRRGFKGCVVRARNVLWVCDARRRRSGRLVHRQCDITLSVIVTKEISLSV